MRHALVLSLALAAGPAAAQGIADMTDAERAAFRDEVRAYLLENPEIIVEAMTVLQSQEEALAARADVDAIAANAGQIFDSGADWIGGNPQGDLTVVEFMDYRCGYCRKAYAEVAELVATDGNIRFIVKEFPILGEESLLASQFAIAVQQLYGPDAYEAAHDALIVFRADITTETLARLAGELGHDPAAVLAHMPGPEVRAVIEANHALADALQINGTPTFVLGDMMLRGYLPLEEMRAVVEEVRADG